MHSRQYFERRFSILPERLARLWQGPLAICNQPSSHRPAAGTWRRPTLMTNAGTEIPLAPTHPRAYNHSYAERVENIPGTRRRMKPSRLRRLPPDLVWANPPANQTRKDLHFSRLLRPYHGSPSM